jgi:DNA-binding NarL/FixJ family response regulator
MDKITIVVVDDHPIFRQGVIDTLTLEPDFAVIGEATGGEEALDVLRSQQPDVAIVDVNLPGLNGQQVTREVVMEKLPTRVILLTAYDDTEQQIHAMRVGAAAYCVKDVQPETLARIVRDVFSGQFVVGEETFNALELERWIAPQTEMAMRPYSDPGEPFQPLSKREMEVLAQLTHGMSNKEIASGLGISHQTVKNHVTSILRKLGVEDRTQAAIYALRRGWVRLHSDSSDSKEGQE